VDIKDIVVDKALHPGSKADPGTCRDSNTHDTRNDGKVAGSKTAKGINAGARTRLCPGPSLGDEDGGWLRPVSPKEWALAQRKDAVLGKLIALKIKYGANKVPKAVLAGLNADARHCCMKMWPSITFVNGVLCRVSKVSKCC
jgi:hypothetical protein